MITRWLVLWLGVSQLICWGISYYLIGGFGDLIAADLGWSRSLVFGGFSAALVVMGLTSQWIGRAIDRHGGRVVMVGGSCLLALGCVGLSAAHAVVTYYAAWMVLGVAMRATLYDAAFASLARIAGSQARRPISQITLLGGLASTAFWPIGTALASLFGWRCAVLAYAGFALATIPLHLAIPNARHEGVKPVLSSLPEPGGTPMGMGRLLAAFLYAGTAALANLLNSGMSAHMIPILAGLGLATSAAVWIATLRGIGQSAARLCEILFGRRLDPFDLNLGACLALPVSFVAGLWSGTSIAAAIVFALVYGSGNGLLTISRGTLPLVLFEPREYGTIVGRLLAPSFLFSAAAPLAYAWLIESFGERAALELSLALALGVFSCALMLKLRFGPRRA
ncbi:MAG: MFS transporter [Hyphomicrobiales bacterium]|nr:MFS transporter [Hyphomicrobiales bacterium]